MEKQRTPPRVSKSPGLPALMAGGLIALVALGTGGAIMLPTNADADGPPRGPVTVEVAGAIGLSVYCGGNETTHANGQSATVTPEGSTCWVEAPLTPAMPLRGRFDLTEGDTYRCERDNVALVCSAVL